MSPSTFADLKLSEKSLHALADVPRDSEVFRSELARAEATRANGGSSGTAERRDGSHHGGGAHRHAGGHGTAHTSAVR